MRSKKSLMIIAALCLGVLCQITALAQGGWDVWTVYLRDGSRIDAAPVWSLDQNVLKYGMSGEVGEGKHLKRSLISFMSRNVAARASSGDVPAMPTGDVKRDTVILTDGRRVSGTVLIRASKNVSGESQHFAPVLVQNGTEIELTKVEHIKLAKPKRSR